MRHADDTADQAPLAHHRIADRNALFGTGVGQAGVGERPARIEDHLGADHRHRRLGVQPQQGAKAGVLIGQGDALVAGQLQLGDLGVQAPVLGHGEEVAADIVDRAADPAHRGRQDRTDRMDHSVGRRPGRAIGLGLQLLAPVAEQHGQADDRGHDQGDRRRPRQRNLEILEWPVPQGHLGSPPRA